MSESPAAYSVATSPIISIAEMANILDTTESTIRSRLAKRQLQVRRLGKAQYSRADFEQEVHRARPENQTSQDDLASAIKQALVELMAENRVSITINVSVEPKGGIVRAFERQSITKVR